MTREEAIEELLSMKHIFIAESDADKALDMAIEALKEQRSLLKISKTVNREELKNIIKNCPMMLITPDTEKIELIREQQWIPCSERLPEKDGKYLITEVDGYVTCDYFRLENGDWRTTFPIAWMPLPEPWKEE